MDDKTIEDLVNAHIERTVTPEALAMAQALRSLKPWRNRLPTEGRVVIAEDVFDQHTPVGAGPGDQSKLVLYVYRCASCGHSGEVRLAESSPEITTACSVCGTEVLAEWDGGVELVNNEPD